MIKLAVTILSLLFLAINPFAVLANTNSFVSVVNPIRGSDFWEDKAQNPKTAVTGQMDILDKFNIPATWLIRYDALFETEIINKLKDAADDEKGIFLEITPTFTKDADVGYHKSENWHDAGSSFLSGYERDERIKLIDKAFAKFKDTFGIYPKSVGAWWIDAFSLSYMQEKYGVVSALIVADQYTTDNYQIWGQFWSTPYYPSKNNILHPAQTAANRLPVVMTQWAARDPVNAYGRGVEESTFSIQANDYTDYHNLNTSYFSSMVDIYTKQQFNQFGHLTVGLENSYPWKKYANEYKNQMKVLREKSNQGQFSLVTMESFANRYKNTFPDLSPTQIIVADDSLGGFKKAVWFMNPYYRVGWFYNQEGSVIRDIRQYIDGEEELCFVRRCDEVNFGTFATRVLDEVTYGNNWIIDGGKISDFNVLKKGDNFVITYLNEVGNLRTIKFLPRDISVDEKISSIDGAILDAIKQDTVEQKKQSEFKEGGFYWGPISVLSKIIKFSFFLLIVYLVPGLVLTDKLFNKDSPSVYLKRVFLALITGFVLLTGAFYIFSLLNLRFLIFVYILLFSFVFLKLKLFYLLKIRIPKPADKLTLATVVLVIAGVIFQNIPSFKNGLVFPFGMGFWGPNTHDGIWHISLINQLIKGLPAGNPIFADTILKNYHFFYDLLIAATAYLTKIPILDLVFRFYPILFSLSLGVGTYFLATTLSKSRIAVILSLYFVYFAGSFGWIVEYIKQKSFGGESAFWANQSISFNLNPPFAVSLLIIIALLLLLHGKESKSLKGILVASLLAGSLVGFKAYGAVLILGALLSIAIVNILKKDLSYLLIFFFSSILTSLIFFLNFQPSQQLIIFSPFWFIHSMIDSPDRIGWVRLSIARTVGFETRNWFKLISAEVISLTLFIVGNLGMRILSIGSLIKIKSIIKDHNLLFILVFSILSIFIPILFIQSGNPWNTIQFFYYGLYVTAVVSGIVLSSLIFNLPRALSFLIIVFVLILTPINSITTASYYTNYLPHGRIDGKELEALTYLSLQKDGTVLTYPYDKKLKVKISEPWPLFAYDSTAYVSALSNKATFLEDEPQNQILLTDYKKRLVASKDFFLKPQANFMKENNIQYIYLPKKFNMRMSENLLSVENIFENEEVIIYKVK
ncbi:hypothetical protein HYS96_02260 [Candidatus Daviesbacteria bacterium]|nr:hypothetical protein [Candidatus Daviesbacteria bacterium]